MSERVPAGSLSYRAAEEVRVALARQNKTQRSLADDLGVSAMWVNDRVNSATEIGLNDLERIAQALKIPVADLIPAEILAGESTVVAA